MVGIGLAGGEKSGKLCWRQGAGCSSCLYNAEEEQLLRKGELVSTSRGAGVGGGGDALVGS